MKVMMWGVGLAALTLAACSSSDGDDDPSYNDLAAEAEALGNEIESIDPTDPATLPTTGSADYDGIMEIGVDIDSDGTTELAALGEMEIAVNFADPANRVSGGAGNFVTEANEEVGGGLTFSNGSLDYAAAPSDFSLLFDVDGTLSHGGTSYDIAADGGAAFGGTQPDYLIGLALGTATAGADVGDFGAIFIGED